MSQLEECSDDKLNNVYAQKEELEEVKIRHNSCLHSVRESISTGGLSDKVRLKQAVAKQVSEMVDTFDHISLKPCEQANVSFGYLSQLFEACQEFGSLFTMSVTTAPTQRIVKSQPQTAAIVRTFHAHQQIRQSVSICFEAQLVSRLTNTTTKCVVNEQSKGVYEISYKPKVGGAHQLHIRIGGEEVRGSPFPLVVKTPVNNLGPVMKTISGVKSPNGVAVNKHGEVITAEGEKDLVYVVSLTGEKLLTLDTQNTPFGRMKHPFGVAVDSEDNILVADSGNFQLLMFSRGGSPVAAVGSKGNGPGQFMNPKGVCANTVNRKVYVVDQDAQCVHIFNSDLTFASKFGRKGCGSGQFNSPQDIASDSRGSLYVADMSNHRIQVFTSEGGYLRQFGKKGNEKGELKHPVSVYVDSDKLVYVGEVGNSRISVFTSEGEFLKSFGSWGSGPEQFNGPNGIAVDQSGVVYVCDHSNNRVQLY